MSWTALTFAVRELEGRDRGLCALDEQLNRFGTGKRRNEPRGFAGDAERFAAGRENAASRTGAKQLLGELGSGIYQVLAIVENEEHRAIGDGRDQRLCWAPPAIGDMERGRDFAGEGRRDQRSARESHPGGFRAYRPARRRRPHARDGFCRFRRPVSVRRRVAPIKPRQLSQLVAATNEPRQVDG